MVSALFGTLAASLLGAGGAAAAAPWEAPVDLSAAGKNGFLAQVGIDAGGETLALWNCFNCGGPAAVQSSNRPSSGSWTPLQNRDPETVNGTYVPDLAVAPSGFAAGTWWRGGFGVNHIIKTSVRAGGSWSPALDVTDEEEGELEGKPFNGGYFPHITVNSKGDAAVVWQECFSPDDVPSKEEEEKETFEFAGPACTTQFFEEIGRYVLRAAYRPAGGSWSAPQTLSKVAETAIKARVAVAENGNAIAVWEGDKLPFDPNNSPKVIHASELKAGQTTWGVPAKQISRTGAEAGEPQVAFDATGNATALFHSRETPSSDLLVESTVLRAGDVNWPAPVQVSATGEATFEPQLAVNAAGSAVAIWRGNASNRIEGKVRTGGAWSSLQQPLSPEGLVAREPKVDIDSAGDAIAIWRVNAAKRQVQGSLLPAGGGWSSPVYLAEGGQNAQEIDLEMNAKGSAVATWRRFDGANEIVQSSYLPAGLGLQAQSIPAQGAAGAPVHFSVSPVALWPGILTTWSFGDGKTAQGSAVSHTYGKGGTYRVTVTSTDGPGNTATASGEITVAAGTLWVSQRLLKVSGNRARVPVMCNRVGACNGVLKLVRGPKAKRTVLGKADFAVGAGRAQTLNVVLNRQAKGLLAANRRNLLSAAVEGPGVRQRSVVLKGKHRRGLNG